MRITQEATLAGRRTVLRFTKQEQSALRSAERIADEARDLLRSYFGQAEAEMMGVDTDLAHIAIGVDEALTEGGYCVLDFEHYTPGEAVRAFFGGTP